mgnify:CR=1 FL=1
MDIEHIRDDFGLDIFNGNSIDDAFAKACQRAFDAGIGERSTRNERVVTHKKTGNKYIIVDDNARDATNEREGQWTVVYKDESGRHFVRDYNEFWLKFEE